jgi:hypothetical protein
MGRLGDHFPPEEKREHIGRQLVPGQVLYLDCDFTTPPKPKLAVLVCTDPEPLLFLVNSRVNAFIQRRPDLLASQVPLKAADYPFLRHDSFLDCSEVKRFAGPGAITEQLLADLSRIQGELTEATRHSILAVVRSSKTLSKVHQRAIEAALSAGTGDPPATTPD